MAALTVWVLDEERADEAVATLELLVSNRWVDLFDAAVVRWPRSAPRPGANQLAGLGTRPLDHEMWDLLVDLTFFPDELGSAVGAAGDALAATAGDLGVTPELGRQLREHLGPGTAALCVYSGGELASSGEHADDIRAVLKGVPTTLLRSNLTTEQEERLRQVFSRAAPEPPTAPAPPTPTTAPAPPTPPTQSSAD